MLGGGDRACKLSDHFELSGSMSGLILPVREVIGRALRASAIIVGSRGREARVVRMWDPCDHGVSRHLRLWASCHLRPVPYSQQELLMKCFRPPLQRLEDYESAAKRGQGLVVSLERTAIPTKVYESFGSNFERLRNQFRR